MRAASAPSNRAAVGCCCACLGGPPSPLKHVPAAGRAARQAGGRAARTPRFAWVQRRPPRPSCVVQQRCLDRHCPGGCNLGVQQPCSETFRRPRDRCTSRGLKALSEAQAPSIGMCQSPGTASAPRPLHDASRLNPSPHLGGPAPGAGAAGRQAAGGRRQVSGGGWRGLAGAAWRVLEAAAKVGGRTNGGGAAIDGTACSRHQSCCTFQQWLKGLHTAPACRVLA